MVNKVGYVYNTNRSSHRIKQAEHELKKDQAERRQAEIEHRRNSYQETFMRGGVVLRTEQIKSLTPAKINGPDGKSIDGFKVEFTNGMVVTYADQKDKRIRSDRYGEISAIFAHDSNIDIYNVNVGNLKGTDKSEDITLRVCYNFNVDGNGGEDTYTSRQRYDSSFNSYKMHIGDVYHKTNIETCEIEDERDAATTNPFVIKDDRAHYQLVQEHKKLDAELKEIHEAKNHLPIFEVDSPKPKLIDNKFIAEVTEKAKEASKQIEGEKILQKAVDFLQAKMRQRMDEATEKEALARQIE